MIFLLSTILIIPSCSSSSDDDDNDNDSSVNGSNETLSFTGESVESLPQVASSSGSSSSFVSPPLFATSGNMDDFDSLSSFFEQECFMPDGDDFCPAGTDTSGGDSNPRKFTIMTLLGLIYHAEIYSDSIHDDCDGTTGSITAASFEANTSGGDPDKYILDYNSLLECVEQDTSVSSGTTYSAYSVDASGDSLGYQATLTSRYRLPYNGSADPGQTDIFQVYVSLDDTTPTFLAFNFAGANTMYSRAVLLVNLVTHKFAAKYYSPGSGTDQAVTAIGVGGVDRDTGVANPGYYFTKFLDNSGSEDTACIDNSDGSIQADNTNCTGNSVPTSWTSSSDVETYLGMTATEISNVSAFLDKFDTEALLTSTDAPEDATDDPELDFPKTITAQ